MHLNVTAHKFDVWSINNSSYYFMCDMRPVVPEFFIIILKSEKLRIYNVLNFAYNESKKITNTHSCYTIFSIKLTHYISVFITFLHDDQSAYKMQSCRREKNAYIINKIPSRCVQVGIT